MFYQEQSTNHSITNITIENLQVSSVSNSSRKIPDIMTDLKKDFGIDLSTPLQVAILKVAEILDVTKEITQLDTIPEKVHFIAKKVGIKV